MTETAETTNGASKKKALTQKEAEKLEQQAPLDRWPSKPKTLLLSDITVNDKLNARGAGKPIDTEDESFKNLLANISERGITSPVFVWDQSGPGGTKYELVAGFRRFAAAKILGYEKIDTRVFELSSELEAYALNGVENIVREDLRPYDRAMRFALMKKRFKVTNEQIAKTFGLSDSYVGNLVRMAEKLGPAQLRHWQKTENAYHLCKRLAKLSKEEQDSDPEWIEVIGALTGPSSGTGRGKTRASGEIAFRGRRPVSDFLAAIDRKDREGNFLPMRVNVPRTADLPGGFMDIEKIKDPRLAFRTAVRFVASMWPPGNQSFFELEEPEEEDEE